jgi:ABC-type arginine transport system permease subunit
MIPEIKSVPESLWVILVYFGPNSKETLGKNRNLLKPDAN